MNKNIFNTVMMLSSFLTKMSLAIPAHIWIQYIALLRLIIGNCLEKFLKSVILSQQKN